MTVQNAKSGTTQQNPPDPGPPIKSRDAAESAMALIVVLNLQLTAALTEQNAKLEAARSSDKEIEALRQKILKHSARLETWARENRAELGLERGKDEKMSLELRRGIIGFKLAAPAVKPLDGQNDKKVLERLLGKSWADAIEKLLTGLRKYVRVKTEINRQKILEDSKPEARRLSAKQLKRMGLEISQDEKFYIEPKLDGVTL